MLKHFEFSICLLYIEIVRDVLFSKKYLTHSETYKITRQAKGEGVSQGKKMSKNNQNGFLNLLVATGLPSPSPNTWNFPNV